MSVKIAIESPLTEDAGALIDASEAVLRSFYAPEECFSFEAEELDRPHISFFVARVNSAALGCVALVNYKDYGEIKRLYVSPEARGQGLAIALMEALEAKAKADGLATVKLETGPLLEAAVRLYTHLGYEVCEAFGEYENLPASLFMEKGMSDG